ncbi:SxtJ family membrane protein [Candidatus Pelagibacter bacterium]|nr:SxtJ family membrane protein [Candidatus Pelagibacter bacterium]
MKSQSANKSFGILFFIVFLIFGLWPLKNGENLNYYFIIFSGIFLLLGLLNSNLLSPLNKIWIKFGEILGIIIAPIIMALVYFAILTPVSLVVRVFGKDLLGLKFMIKQQTYWINRKKKMGSMRKQF